MPKSSDAKQPSRRQQAKKDLAKSIRSALPASDLVGRNVAAFNEWVAQNVLSQLNVVLLTRERIEEVVQDAVMRGRMTRNDAHEMIQNLVQLGRKQSDDMLADLDKLIGRGRGDLGLQRVSSSKTRPSKKGTKRSAATGLAIKQYDELSAAHIQEQLGGLTPQQLRKVRDYERRHGNRKTVLDAIERKLR